LRSNQNHDKYNYQKKLVICSSNQYKNSYIMDTPQQHAIAWFEIPVTDFDRAKNFYEGILNITMHTTEVSGYKMGFFPTVNEAGLSGAICYGEGYIPSGAGSLIYLNANPDVNDALAKVQDFGGRILTAKGAVGDDMGHFAFILDTEGNRIALHSIH
jgi:uncharacterized protein